MLPLSFTAPCKQEQYEAFTFIDFHAMCVRVYDVKRWKLRMRMGHDWGEIYIRFRDFRRLPADFQREARRKKKLKAKTEIKEKTFFQFHSTDDDARVRSSSSRQGFTFEF